MSRRSLMSSLLLLSLFLNLNAQQPTKQPSPSPFREGKPVFTGNPLSLEVTGQRDLQRLTGGAELQLGEELLPGEYVLQIIVEDHLAKEKQYTVTQWIDFEVVK